MPTYFDAHSHLNFPQYDKDREKVVRRMRDEDVWTITVGTSAQTSKEAVDLARGHEHLFATIGVHPTDAAEGFDDVCFNSLVSNSKVVAVGECGLDYFRLGDELSKEKETQRSVFEQHIDFALKHDMPIMFHLRPSKGTMDAYEDALDMLGGYSRSHRNGIRGNSHFFVGDVDVARGFLDLGITLSFDGPITFTREYDEVVRFVPIDMIIAETDAPFAAPEPYRGKRNEPVYVKRIVEAMSKIRGGDFEALRTALVDNVFRMFKIPGPWPGRRAGPV